MNCSPTWPLLPWRDARKTAIVPTLGSFACTNLMGMGIMGIRVDVETQC